jgi:hypothetical protein
MKVMPTRGDFSEESSHEDEVDLIAYEVMVRLCIMFIATDPIIFPYYDMINWIIDHVILETWMIMKYGGTKISSFKMPTIGKMYKLRSP